VPAFVDVTKAVGVGVDLLGEFSPAKGFSHRASRL